MAINHTPRIFQNLPGNGNFGSTQFHFLSDRQLEMSPSINSDISPDGYGQPQLHIQKGKIKTSLTLQTEGVVMVDEVADDMVTDLDNSYAVGNQPVMPNVFQEIQLNQEIFNDHDASEQELPDEEVEMMREGINRSLVGDWVEELPNVANNDVENGYNSEDLTEYLKLQETMKAGSVADLESTTDDDVISNDHQMDGMDLADQEQANMIADSEMDEPEEMKEDQTTLMEKPQLDAQVISSSLDRALESAGAKLDKELLQFLHRTFSSSVVKSYCDQAKGDPDKLQELLNVAVAQAIKAYKSRNLSGNHGGQSFAADEEVKEEDVDVEILQEELSGTALDPLSLGNGHQRMTAVLSVPEMAPTLSVVALSRDQQLEKLLNAQSILDSHLPEHNIYLRAQTLQVDNPAIAQRIRVNNIALMEQLSGEALENSINVNVVSDTQKVGQTGLQFEASQAELIQNELTAVSHLIGQQKLEPSATASRQGTNEDVQLRSRSLSHEQAGSAAPTSGDLGRGILVRMLYNNVANVDAEGASRSDVKYDEANREAVIGLYYLPLPLEGLNEAKIRELVAYNERVQHQAELDAEEIAKHSNYKVNVWIVDQATKENLDKLKTIQGDMEPEEAERILQEIAKDTKETEVAISDLQESASQDLDESEQQEEVDGVDEELAGGGDDQTPSTHVSLGHRGVDKIVIGVQVVHNMSEAEVAAHNRQVENAVNQHIDSNVHNNIDTVVKEGAKPERIITAQSGVGISLGGGRSF